MRYFRCDTAGKKRAVLQRPSKPNLKKRRIQDRSSKKQIKDTPESVVDRANSPASTALDQSPPLVERSTRHSLAIPTQQRKGLPSAPISRRKSRVNIPIEEESAREMTTKAQWREGEVNGPSRAQIFLSVCYITLTITASLYTRSYE